MVLCHVNAITRDPHRSSAIHSEGSAIANRTSSDVNVTPVAPDILAFPIVNLAIAHRNRCAKKRPELVFVHRTLLVKSVINANRIRMDSINISVVRHVIA